MLESSWSRSQECARDWRTSATYARVDGYLAHVDPGDVAVGTAAAEALLAKTAWIDPLLEPLFAALIDDPWFEPPFRVARDPLRIGAIIYDGPAATLTATILSAASTRAAPKPQTIAVSGRMAVARYVRAGGATLARWDAGVLRDDLDAATARPAHGLEPLPLNDGAVVRLDGRTTGHLLHGASSNVVTLTVALRATRPGYVREYAISDGRLIRAAALDEAASRTQMLLTFLRLSGRADASPCFAEVTRAAPFHLRWTPMRSCRGCARWRMTIRMRRCEPPLRRRSPWSMRERRNDASRDRPRHGGCDRTGRTDRRARCERVRPTR